MFNGTLLDFFWTMAIIFFWVIAIMIWFRCFIDLFGRQDMTGVMKGIWIVALIFIPWLGALVYIITRPKVTATDVQMMVRAEAAGQAAAKVSTADELAKLADLKEKGVINDAQYEDLKAKLIA
jgi:hypothetical protein